MSFVMMLAACGGGTLKSKPFTANETWLVPATTSMLVSAVGKGAAGSPESSGSYYQWYLEKYRWTQIYYIDGTSESLIYPGPLVSKTTTTAGSAIPAPYCDAKTDASSSYPPGTKVSYCYHYKKVEELVEYGSPATTGASTTGFTKTFPGGYGGPATLTSYDNVPVTPGAPYNIVVPSGGSITITYYE